MKKTKNLSRQAMIAAMYVVLSVALSPITYGAVQARISEALTLLPIYNPATIWAVTLGCFLTNLIGLFTGANILGALDIIFGTLATLVAAFLTYKFRNIQLKGLPILSVIPPILINAIVIGWELCIMIAGGFSWPIFIAQAISVALGQALSCGVIGLVMVVGVINKNPKLKELIGSESN